MHVARQPVKLGDHDPAGELLGLRQRLAQHGPAFKRGLRVPEFDNVDVYPLLAHLLDIAPQASDGRFDDVRAMLEPN